MGPESHTSNAENQEKWSEELTGAVAGAESTIQSIDEFIADIEAVKETLSLPDLTPEQQDGFRRDIIAIEESVKMSMEDLARYLDIDGSEEIVLSKIEERTGQRLGELAAKKNEIGLQFSKKEISEDEYRYQLEEIKVAEAQQHRYLAYIDAR